MSQNNPSQDDNYFNLHLTGLGYLNRVREVPVKRGSNFFAVDISAMHGKSDDVQYTRFDCRVSGKQAEAILAQIKTMIDNDENKVLVGFKLGDLYPDIFVYKKGKKEGQTGVSLKARLLRIEWVKVNGKMIEIDLPQTA